PISYLFQCPPFYLDSDPVFFFSSRRRHTISVSAFLLNRSSDLDADPKFFACWFALSLLRFRLPSRLPMMFILWMVAMMVVIIPRSEERRVGKEFKAMVSWYLFT